MTKVSQKTAHSFRSVIPAEFQVEAVYARLKTELEKFGKFQKLEGEKTTRFWKDSPLWIVRTTVNSTVWKLELIVRGSTLLVKRWTYLDEGTKPHIIRAKHAKALAFKWGGPGSYSAGSSPGTTFTSRPTVRGSTTYRKYVRHPGTAARNWSKVIKRDTEPGLIKWMTAAMSHAARESGHLYSK